MKSKKYNNKNNTCYICEKHIDKSDAAHNWTTIITASYIIDNPAKDTATECGYDIIKGSRVTLCEHCAWELVGKPINEKRLSILKEKEQIAVTNFNNKWGAK